MECEVIGGGTETIRRCRPIIYAENDRAARQREMIELIAGLGYRLFWHTPLLADRHNHNGVQEGIFGAPIRSLNMLCIPSERKTTVADLVAIDPANWHSPIPAREDG